MFDPFTSGSQFAAGRSYTLEKLARARPIRDASDEEFGRRALMLSGSRYRSASPRDNNIAVRCQPVVADNVRRVNHYLGNGRPPFIYYLCTRRVRLYRLPR